MTASPGPALGDWPEDFTHENGWYSNRCISCDRQFIGHKRRVTCKLCSSRPHEAQADTPLLVALERISAYPERHNMTDGGDSSHKAMAAIARVALAAARQGAAPAAAPECEHDWSTPVGFATKRCNRCLLIAPASKGDAIVYDPAAYRSVRRDQAEAVVRAFCPDAVEAAELLDCVTGPLQRQQDDAPDVDLEKALEHLGQARFFLLRVPS